VRAVPVEARRLLVIDGASQLWKAQHGELDAHGAIVWYEPPGDSTDAAVAKVVEELKAAGAVKVVVLPHAAVDSELPREQVEQAAAAFSGGAAQARKVALELIEAARVDAGVKLGAAALVDRYLSEVGL
jgi:hypothetical protein